MTTQERELLQKLRSLPAEKLVEVEDFVDFLHFRSGVGSRQLTRAAAKLAEGSFREVWDNPDDDAYDQL